MRHMQVASHNAHKFNQFTIGKTLHPISKPGAALVEPKRCKAQTWRTLRRRKPACRASKEQTQSERVNHAPANVLSQYSRLARRGTQCAKNNIQRCSV